MIIKDINKINYSEIVSILRERNRPSGGIRTIQNVAVNSFMNSSKKMLEIGSNTGFTCVNMSLLTGCNCVGIDINRGSIIEAKEYAIKQNVQEKVSFIETNVEKLPFEDNSFDLVWCSNVISFIEKKNKAIEECLRVLKKGGTLVLIPIYYLRNPPKKIISKVSEAIGVEIKSWSKKYWIEMFEGIGEKLKMPLELYFSKDFVYRDRKEFIENYVNLILDKPHLKNFSNDVKTELLKRYKYFIELFNENLKYSGFSILLFQKRNIKDEEELFLTE